MQRSEPPEAVFGARVRQLRQELGIPRESLAATVQSILGTEMAPSELARLENGERPIRLTEAVALAAILDVTVQEMLVPLPPPDEQLRRAEGALQAASTRVAQVQAEYEFARDRLQRLQTSLAHHDGSGAEGRNGGGEVSSPPPLLESRAAVDPDLNNDTDSGGFDSPRLAQGQDHAAAG